LSDWLQAVAIVFYTPSDQAATAQSERVQPFHFGEIIHLIKAVKRDPLANRFNNVASERTDHRVVLGKLHLLKPPANVWYTQHVYLLKNEALVGYAPASASVCLSVTRHSNKSGTAYR
jgi:hypothetical protein